MAGEAVVDTGKASLIGGPVASGWREGTLTRSHEIESLSRSVFNGRCTSNGTIYDPSVLLHSIEQHVLAAQEAAKCYRLVRRPRSPSLWERARSNLDAAEAQLINIAPPEYVLGQMPSLLNHVQRHLPETDPRRKHFEHVAERLGFKDPEMPARPEAFAMGTDEKTGVIEEQRGEIASIVRGASSAGLREQLRVRSFRNVVIGAILLTLTLAVSLAVIGLRSPAAIPLCFEPERGGQTMVVCPTQQSPLTPVTQGVERERADVDDVLRGTASRWDILLVEFLGLAAAAVSAAAAIRHIRGSSERYGLPVALTILKLPTGALTAVLGIVLMRGQFVPGLTALDTPGQILAWSLIFGYSQELFTRLVDRQAHTVLDGVRGGTEANRHTAERSSIK